MEGHAGTRQLNPTDAEDAPVDPVAVTEQEQAGQEPREAQPKGQPQRRRTMRRTAVRRAWAEDGRRVSASGC